MKGPPPRTHLTVSTPKKEQVKADSSQALLTCSHCLERRIGSTAHPSPNLHGLAQYSSLAPPGGLSLRHMQEVASGFLNSQLYLGDEFLDHTGLYPSRLPSASQAQQGPQPMTVKPAEAKYPGLHLDPV